MRVALASPFVPCEDAPAFDPCAVCGFRTVWHVGPSEYSSLLESSIRLFSLSQSVFS